MLDKPCRYLFTLLALLTLLTAQPLAIGDTGPDASKTLRYVGPNVKPTMYLDDKNEPAGPLISLVKTIARHAGYSLAVRLSEIDDITGALIRGQADFTVMVHHPKLELSAVILSSPEPLGHLVLNLYHQPNLPKLNHIYQLKHKKVVLLKGYSYGGLQQALAASQEPPLLYEVNTAEKALHMLQARRADYALLYSLSFNSALPNTDYKAEQFSVSNLSKIPFYIHVSKQGSENPEALMDQLLSSYHDLAQQGKLDIYGF